ncbi:MAG TPA: hypothetical protein VGI33_12910 [Paenibacillus sp.]|jgi:hypothetical protein
MNQRIIKDRFIQFASEAGGRSFIGITRYFSAMALVVSGYGKLLNKQLF